MRQLALQHAESSPTSALRVLPAWLPVDKDANGFINRREWAGFLHKLCTPYESDAASDQQP